MPAGMISEIYRRPSMSKTSVILSLKVPRVLHECCSLAMRQIAEQRKADRGSAKRVTRGRFAFYCTNHKPGRWLTGQVCAQCGAAYGRPDPRPVGPRTPKSAPVTPPFRRTGTSKTRSSPVSSGPRDRPGPWEGRRSPHPPPESDYVSEEVSLGLRRSRDYTTYWAEHTQADERRTAGPPTYSVAPLIAGWLPKICFAVASFPSAFLLRAFDVGKLVPIRVLTLAMCQLLVPAAGVMRAASRRDQQCATSDPETAL